MSIKDFLLQHHKPQLAEEAGMVYQFWEDGEVTLQKSGELLWQRTLHQIVPPSAAIALCVDDFPEQRHRHGYIFTDRDGVKACLTHFQHEFAEFFN